MMIFLNDLAILVPKCPRCGGKMKRLGDRYVCLSTQVITHFVAFIGGLDTITDVHLQYGPHFLHFLHLNFPTDPNYTWLEDYKNRKVTERDVREALNLKS